MNKSYLCNPLNINYKYQFNRNPMDGSIDTNREAADPSLICYQEKYYIFASMSLGVYVSEDLANWSFAELPPELPLYGYAPDVRVRGDYVYFCCNESEEICNFYRTQDIVNGPYEKINGSFSFHDPNLFFDDDGRTYFYWGLSCKEPIWGMELYSDTLQPKSGRMALIEGNPLQKGFERIGTDHSILPCEESELEKKFAESLEKSGISDKSLISDEMSELIKDMLRDRPYIEGAWMNKFNGTYYLQYAFPGTHLHTYGDGVYYSHSPLGPFRLAKNNPFSYKPGGYITGAGHGSTIEDRYGNLWHAATMRISKNHQFERRLGLWLAGIDDEGELYCNQRYGDWPLQVRKEKMDVWKEPDWFLLSYRKNVVSSSHKGNCTADYVADEDITTWWQAGTKEPGEWVEIDLGEQFCVNAVQINFADDKTSFCCNAGENLQNEKESRYIEKRGPAAKWILEGSSDQVNYFLIRQNTEARTDLSHDFCIEENGLMARYIKLTVIEVPYGVEACISGLRVFGTGSGKLPETPDFCVVRRGDLDMEVSISECDATGYNILWGLSPQKLYHCYQTYEAQKRIGALVKGSDYYVRVDAFNENGIRTGIVKKL